MASTAESKNARMNEERSFFAKLAEASLSGNYIKVQSMCEEYARQHSVSVYDTITQFKDGKGRTILHFACQSINNNPKKTEYRSKAEFEEDVVYQLLRSEWANQHKIVELDRAATETQHTLMRCKDTDGITPLMAACQLAEKDSHLSHHRVRTLLLAGGNKLALARSKDGATSLHYAAGSGANEAIISQLYDAAKAAIAVNSKGGGTPLHWAAGAKTNVVPTMETLISYCHADIHAKNEHGITPLVVALASGNDDNATFLVERGNDEDKSVILTGNVTVYHLAADMNLPRALRALLNSDGNDKLSETCRTMKNVLGETPLDLAVLSGNIRCAMVLLPNDHLGYSDESETLAFMDQRKIELENEKTHEHNRKKKIDHLEAKNHELDITNKSNVEYESKSVEDRAKADAERACKTVISAEQKDSGLKHKKNGNDLFGKDCFVDAAIEYTKAIEADPTDLTYYSNRSACYMALKQYDEALYDAAVCRCLKPDWAKGCYRLSVARLALGMHEDAALSAWEGMQLDNDNEDLKSLLQKAVKLGKKEHLNKTAEEKLTGKNSNEIDDISNV